jgi:hypothetical protein
VKEKTGLAGVNCDARKVVKLSLTLHHRLLLKKGDNLLK